MLVTCSSFSREAMEPLTPIFDSDVLLCGHQNVFHCLAPSSIKNASSGLQNTNFLLKQVASPSRLKINTRICINFRMCLVPVIYHTFCANLTVTRALN